MTHDKMLETLLTFATKRVTLREEDWDGIVEVYETIRDLYDRHEPHLLHGTLGGLPFDMPCEAAIATIARERDEYKARMERAEEMLHDALEQLVMVFETNGQAMKNMQDILRRREEQWGSTRRSSTRTVKTGARRTVARPQSTERVVQAESVLGAEEPGGTNG